MVFFLALRNITRNKKNSAVIALLIAVITFLFFVGNSTMGRVDRIIRQAYTENLSGDVVLEKTADVTMSLFGANTPVIDSLFTIPVLPAHDAVIDLLADEPEIAGMTSQVSGKTLLYLLGVHEPVLLCGVNGDSYFPLFPGIILEEGRFLRSGEYGAMITEERARKIEAQSGTRPAAGMPLLLSSGGIAGFKIRHVPLVGIFSYQNPGQFMNEIVIADAQTVRVLNSIQVAGADGEIDEGFTNLLDADPDDLFGGSANGADDVVSGALPDGAGSDGAGGNDAGDTATSAVVAGGNDTGGAVAADTAAGFSAEFLETYLGDSGGAALGDARETGGDWNFIILRLKEGVSAGAFIERLNKKLVPFGISAVNWRIAAGASAILPLLVQVLFNAGIFLVSVAGVIAVINIFLISVFRRTREIGTLRAIGASDLYIRSLVLCENLIIALIAGLSGLFLGLVCMRLLNGLGLHISNNLIALTLGGPALKFSFLPHIALISVAMAVLLGLAASVYPVEAAVRIEPVDAVRRG